MKGSTWPTNASTVSKTACAPSASRRRSPSRGPSPPCSRAPRGAGGTGRHSAPRRGSPARTPALLGRCADRPEDDAHLPRDPRRQPRADPRRAARCWPTRGRAPRPRSTSPRRPHASSAGRPRSTAPTRSSPTTCRSCSRPTRTSGTRCAPAPPTRASTPAAVERPAADHVIFVSSVAASRSARAPTRAGDGRRSATRTRPSPALAGIRVARRASGCCSACTATTTAPRPAVGGVPRARVPAARTRARSSPSRNEPRARPRASGARRRRAAVRASRCTRRGSSRPPDDAE